MRLHQPWIVVLVADDSLLHFAKVIFRVKRVIFHLGLVFPPNIKDQNLHVLFGSIS